MVASQFDSNKLLRRLAGASGGSLPSLIKSDGRWETGYAVAHTRFNAYARLRTPACACQLARLHCQTVISCATLMHINSYKGDAMRSTVTIEKTMLDELLTETHATSKASAVKVAISDYLRRRRKDKIKSMKGKLEFDLTAEELRHFER